MRRRAYRPLRGADERPGAFRLPQLGEGDGKPGQRPYRWRPSGCASSISSAEYRIFQGKQHGHQSAGQLIGHPAHVAMIVQPALAGPTPHPNRTRRAQAGLRPSRPHHCRPHHCRPPPVPPLHLAGHALVGLACSRPHVRRDGRPMCAPSRRQARIGSRHRHGARVLDR